MLAAFAPKPNAWRRSHNPNYQPRITGRLKRMGESCAVAARLRGGRTPACAGSAGWSKLPSVCGPVTRSDGELQMLTEKQARDIVDATIAKIMPEKKRSAEEKLQDIVASPDKRRDLVTTLAADSEVGVPRFQHYLDPNIIIELQPGLSINALTEKILKLSAGKLCSNPRTPHPQTCCPYPAKCPQCGYPVL
jgi:hypothetical protein